MYYKATVYVMTNKGYLTGMPTDTDKLEASLDSMQSFLLSRLEQAPHGYSKSKLHRELQLRPLQKCLRLPLWRTVGVSLLALVGTLLLESNWSWARYGWTLVWPTVALLILVEAVLLVFLMYDEARSEQSSLDVDHDNVDHVMVHVGGLGGLVRLFDVWLSWAVAVGCCLLLFHLYGHQAYTDTSLLSIGESTLTRTSVHTHFSGFETLKANASSFEALSYFIPLSLSMCTSSGVLVLEPTSVLSRWLMTVLGTLAFLFQVTIIFTGAAEALTSGRYRK
jgi:hypothetical protein